MRDPGQVQVLESIQRAWATNNGILNRALEHDLPFTGGGWRPVDGSRDSGERFGYSEESIRRPTLKTLRTAALREAVEGLGGSRGGRRGADEVGSGLNSHGRTEAEEEARRIAITRARVRKALKESRTTGARGGGGHLSAPVEFITSAKALLKEWGLVVADTGGRRGGAHTADGLFRILCRYLNAGETSDAKVKDVRKEIAAHMAGCPRCRRLLLADEHDLYAKRGHDDGEREQIVRQHCA